MCSVHVCRDPLSYSDVGAPRESVAIFKSSLKNKLITQANIAALYVCNDSVMCHALASE